MRVRDKSRTTAFGWNQAWGGPSWSNSTSGTTLVTLNDVMTDLVVKDFKRLSANGMVFNNPMEKFEFVDKVPLFGTWRKSKPVPGGENFWQTNLAWHDWYVDYHPGKDKITVDEVSRLETLAITQAYADVGNDMSMLVELAEIKKTFDFLISPVRSLVRQTKRLNRHMDSMLRAERRYQRQLSRYENLSPRRRAKTAPPEKPRRSFDWGSYTVTDLSSLWLAYRYALMPILYSLQDAQKLFERKLDPLAPMRVTSRAKEEGRISHAATTPYAYYYANNGDTMERHHRTGHANISVRAGVLYIPRYELTNELGIELHRVPAAMWELVPLSFVADWFQNGSQYYDALTAKLRAQKILSAWTTTHVDFDVNGYFEMSSNSPSTTASGLAPSFRGSGKWKRRKVSFLSDVGFEFKINLNSKRVADGLALTHVLLQSAMDKSKPGRRPN